MSYKYCTDCGYKISYVGSLPKFCSECGTTFGDGIKRVIHNSIAVRKSNVLGDDETDASYVPEITALQYDMAPFEKKTFSLLELIGPGAADDKSADLPDVERPTEET